MNIVEIAAGSDDFNILVQALSTAGLVETIQNANDITVFAPTDAAFTALAVDLGFDGDQSDEDAVFAFIAGALTALDPDGDPLPLLTQILTYHVSPGAKDSAAVTALTNIGTLEGTEIVRDGLVLQDQEPDVADPTLETLDIPADNGIIHTIDRVLLPIDIPGNTNIVDIALASDDLNILVRALSTAGLVETIQNATDITVFAPTDAAFAQTAVDLGFTGEVTDEDAVFNFIVAALTGLAEDDNPLPLLTQILTYHVAGEVLDAAAVTAADSIPTLQGGAITPAVPVLGDL
ncbi:MAG: fasciclin domain-containing protein, partial [Pseudomonadota bacterium]